MCTVVPHQMSTAVPVQLVNRYLPHLLDDFKQQQNQILVN